MQDARQDEGRFMVAVGAVIEHAPTGRILMMQRAATADYRPGLWEDLTGRMKQFEEPEDALRREIHEETGLEIEIVKPIKIFHLFRGERTAENELVGIVYWCTAQSDRVTLSHEHDNYRWLLPHEALEVADDPGIREDIEAFMEERAGRLQANDRREKAQFWLALTVIAAVSLLGTVLWTGIDFNGITNIWWWLSLLAVIALVGAMIAVYIRRFR